VVSEIFGKVYNNGRTMTSYASNSKSLDKPKMKLGLKMLNLTKTNDIYSVWNAIK
jgi:hypothetical protein